jgi:drug/metabolite transporter (DMT)-like permease
MNLTRSIGLAVAAVGVVLLIMGLNATEAPLERLSETVSGRYTDQTIAYIIGGIAAVVGGVVLAVRAPKAG